MTDLVRAHNQYLIHLEVFRMLSKRTISWHQDSVRSLLKFKSNLSLAQITKSTLEKWFIYGSREQGWAPKTIIGRIDALNLFFKWAVDQNLIESNPAENLPRPKLPKRIPKHLSKKEAEHLIQFTRNYPYHYEQERKRAVAIISTFIGTGLRKEELRTLQRNDVDLEMRQIMVRAGKGDKDRLIPIPPNLIDVLRDYLSEQVKLKRCSPFFFSSWVTDREVSAPALNRLLTKLKKSSGINFSAHKLRHTFAVMMLEGGCDIFALSKMLGHTNIKTTTIYLYATTAHLQDQICKHPVQF